ncbi:hypothetical protein [Qipengyuania flava]|uniref:hypothetical protein n=1 Tax=Qipengyuania flava TaxID=192812 RepID=UPI0012FD67D9|nr:hypothetical protein [Qipengyuania flava]
MAIDRTLRTTPLLAALALCACEAAPDIASEGGTPVACALGSATDFASECRLVELSDGSGAVIRHPDGGFRKLVQADTPAGYAEFDGAQRATSRLEGDSIVLTIGADRYRWQEQTGD